MSIPNPLELIGATASPYTRKMLALLRYRRIPYAVTWGDPSAVLAARGIESPRIPFLPTFLFTAPSGELEAVCDSTPITHRLENTVAGRSAIPADPTLAFINYLLEDFGDEWCTKYMFHYRWHFAPDADNAGTLLPLAANLTVPPQTHRQLKAHFTERQVGRLGFVGSNEQTAPIIDASYRRLLNLLETHFEQEPFLLGARPGSADFALLGQLTQLVGFDPTPRAIAHELSPRTVAWVGVTEDLSGLEPADGDWCSVDALPDTLRNILGEVGRTYVPALLANAAAIESGQKQWSATIDGALWSQNTFPYQGKCLAWIRQEYAALDDASRSRVDTVLAGTGCEKLLV